MLNRGPSWSVVASLALLACGRSDEGRGAAPTADAPSDAGGPTSTAVPGVSPSALRDAKRRFLERFLETKPRLPDGWTPQPHEAVVARHLASGWYRAIVVAPTGGGIRVKWSAEGWKEQALPPGDVAPLRGLPPPRTGDYVLVPPSSDDEAWQPHRVEAVGEEVRLVSWDGKTVRRDASGLVPFSK